MNAIVSCPARAGVAVAALLAALTTGCATSRPPPHGFDPERVRIVPMVSVPVLDVSGLPGGKVVGAGVGAGTGSGAGALAGGAVCLAAGPFFPLCLLAVVPTAAIVGAVTGGVVGAVKSEGLDAMALKTKAVADTLVATPYQTRIAERLQAQMGRSGETASPASDDARPWTLEVGVVEVGTEGKRDFAVRLVARLRLRQGDAAPVWESAKEVQSDTELTTTQWLADDSQRLHEVLERCIDQAAHQFAADLGAPAPGGSALGRAKTKYSSSCEDAAPLRVGALAAGEAPTRH